MERLPLAAALAQPFHSLGVDDREKPRPLMVEHLVGDGRTHTAKTSEKRPSAPQPPLLGSCWWHRAEPRRIERPESPADIDVREHLLRSGIIASMARNSALPTRASSAATASRSPPRMRTASSAGSRRLGMTSWTARPPEVAEPVHHRRQQPSEGSTSSHSSEGETSQYFLCLSLHVCRAAAADREPGRTRYMLHQSMDQSSSPKPSVLRFSRIAARWSSVSLLSWSDSMSIDTRIGTPLVTKWDTTSS